MRPGEHAGRAYRIVRQELKGTGGGLVESPRSWRCRRSTPSTKTLLESRRKNAGARDELRTEAGCGREARADPALSSARGMKEALRAVLAIIGQQAREKAQAEPAAE